MGERIQITGVVAGRPKRFECPAKSDTIEVPVTVRRAAPYPDVTGSALLIRTQLDGYGYRWDRFGNELSHWLSKELIEACDAHDCEAQAETGVAPEGFAEPGELPMWSIYFAAVAATTGW